MPLHIIYGAVLIGNATHHLVGHVLLFVRPEQPLQVRHPVLEERDSTAARM